MEAINTSKTGSNILQRVIRCSLDTSKHDKMIMPSKCAKDKKAPSITCVSSSKVVFEKSTTKIWAKDFYKSAFDNCTSADSLIFPV